MIGASAILALVFALAGPPVIALWGTRLAARPFAMTTNLACQAALVGLLAVTLGLFASAGRADLASLRMQWPDEMTAVRALAMAVFFIVVLGPILMRLPQWLGLAGFEQPLAQLASLPVWYLLLAVVIGGTVEEILYRGIALGLLSELTGSPAIAAILIVLAFGAAHWPLWGPGPALTTVISGGVLMGFVLWHGDLVANILAHIATDFVGIVLPLLLARLRKA